MRRGIVKLIKKHMFTLCGGECIYLMYEIRVPMTGMQMSSLRVASFPFHHIVVYSFFNILWQILIIFNIFVHMKIHVKRIYIVRRCYFCAEHTTLTV